MLYLLLNHVKQILFSAATWVHVCVLAILIACGASVAPAAEGQIDLSLKRVIIYGLTEEEETVVRSSIPIPLGEPLTEADIRAFENLEATIEQANFSRKLQNINVRPVQDDASGASFKQKTINDISELELLMDFRLPPTVEEITIYPLVPVKTKDFLKALPQVIGLEYVASVEQSVIAALEEEAKRQEILAPVILTNHVMKTDTTIQLGFIVQDATPEPLRKIRFRDAGFGNAVKIRNFLKEPDPVGFDKGDAVRGEQLLEIQNISSELMRSMGYLRATTRLDETSVSRKGVKVYYRIDRGPQFDMDRITAVGNVFPDPEFWHTATRRFQGKSLNAKRLRDIEAALRRRSLKSGYMDPKIDVRYKPIGEDEVEITASIDEGDKSKMGKVIVERKAGELGYGSSWYHRTFAPKLKDSIIEKQVRASRGDDLNLGILDDAERRMNRLGVFEEVALDTRATTDSATRDVVATVTDARTANLGASVGWNDQLGAVVRLDFVERNIGGGADVFGFGGYYSLNNNGYGGDISYTDRYNKLWERLIGERREPSVTYSATYNTTGYQQYTETRLGGRIRLNYLTGKRAGPWSNGVQLRVEDISYETLRERDRYDEDFNDYLATTVAYNIAYDTRNRGDDDSTEGFLFDTGLEVGRADGLLAKWSNTAEWTQPISRYFAWFQRGQFGLMPYNADRVGITDRFQSGGLGSVRGFTYRGIGPVDGRVEELQLGGSTMTSLQNEIRFIVSEDVDVPFFLDFGTLESGPMEFGTIRSSVGTGLRIRMPNSRQRAFIYYAEELTSEATDNGRQIHFGFRFDL
ncbi:MAG: outer membrane protein assembly factor [Sumerlaeia bacterium]